MRLLGLDPGLRHSGWGIIDIDGSRLQHVANGSVASTSSADLADRLVELYDGLSEVIGNWGPTAAAVEETFVNRNPGSTLKLGQARGVSLLVAAHHGLAVTEYSPNFIKKSVVGTGHASKEQIHAMVGVLLPTAEITDEHAADALAVALCHAHNAATRRRLKASIGG